MDFRESEEQEMLRETIAKIASRFGHSYYADKARTGAKTNELWDAIAEGGFVGVNLPESHGGGGMGLTGLSVVCEELSAAGCPLLLLVVSPAIAGTVIARYGTPDQQDRFLPGIASGRLKFSFAITEPDAGSNSHRLATVATRDGDGYRLSGTKQFISGVDEADQILVVARTGTDASGRASLSLLVVPPDAPGLERHVIPMEIVAPEKQFVLFFDNVWVGEENLLGREGDGLRQIFFGLNPERVTSAAMACGVGRYALTRAAEYARSRSVWGVPIGSHQGIAHPLARAKVEVELARLATAKAAFEYDTGLEAGESANMAKYAAAEAANFALDQAIQTLGGNGLACEYGLADIWGMTRLFRIAPISREMILNFVAQHSLGLPRSY
jgi:alkylation response protein AidB-like acyl-CoA dehydrogenase